MVAHGYLITFSGDSLVTQKNLPASVADMGLNHDLGEDPACHGQLSPCACY